MKHVAVSYTHLDVYKRQGGDDVKSSCPLRPGLQACYNGWYNKTQNREAVSYTHLDGYKRQE